MTLSPDFTPTTPSVERPSEPAPEMTGQRAVVTGYGIEAPITLDLDMDAEVLQGHGPAMEADEDLSHLDGIGLATAQAPAVDVVLDRAYRFNDPAAPAVLAALPAGREDGTLLTLTHLQLRSLAVAAILSLNDMNTAEVGEVAQAPVKPEVSAPVLRSIAVQDGLKGKTVADDGIDSDEGQPLQHPNLVLDEHDLAAGISALPKASVVADRVERVIEELVKGFLVEVPRVDPALDDIDRSVKHNGFVRDEAWTRRLVQGAPQTAYQMTPEGIAVGRLIRTTNAGEVRGVAGDHSVVALPTKGLAAGEDPIARVAFAAAETGHAFLLDHLYGAMQLKPGEMGRMLGREAMSIQESLTRDGNFNPDVVGGRIISNLDAMTDSVGAFLLEEEAEVLLGDLPVRHQEISEALDYTMGSLALAPDLVRDPYVLESLANADAVCCALRVIEAARVRSEGDFTTPKAWDRVKEFLGSLAKDTRLVAVDKEAGNRLAAAGMNPVMAEVPLVPGDIRQERVVAIVKDWLANTWAAGNAGMAQRALDAFLGQVPSPATAA